MPMAESGFAVAAELLGENELEARRILRIGDRCVFDCEAVSTPAAAYYMQIATGHRAP